MKREKLIFSILTIGIILIGGIYSLIKWNSQKEIDKYAIDVSKFIDCVDEVSANKVQVNWKHVAAIVGVIEKNKFDKVDDLEIIEVAQMFINEKEELRSLDEVLEELDFKKGKIEKTYKYIEDLKYYSITPNRTQNGTKQTKFIESIKEGAIENYKKYKVLPSITIAQGILESNWGESKLASEHNNLFGIKADVYWKGEHTTLETTEYNGIVINDKFRKYDDKNESIIDHGKFLADNKRYKNNGVFDANTYIYQAKALQEAGYSTLINEKGEKVYAKQLVELIKQYNLQVIDSEIKYIR
ncbi:MAG: glycoside hydrolase family 73 protein [Peptostreptococcaceae bacterium]